ncbi:MAG: glycosyltransferase family 4 protein [Bacteroidales bacterium]
MFSYDVLNLICAAGLSFVITYILIPPIVRVARAKNLYDSPGRRKPHKNDVPTLGGAAIFAGLVLAMTLFVDGKLAYQLRYFVAAAIIIFYIGIKDDILGLGPVKKLVAQILSAIIIAVPAHVRFTSLHGFLGIHHIPDAYSVVLTVFVIIVIINSLNLIDGIDGLAALTGIIASSTFGVWFWLSGDYSYTIMASALAGALLAFLRFNLSSGKNKIFMGDTGALLIGLVLAILAIRFNEANVNAGIPWHLTSAPAVSIGILILPLFDTLRVFVLRMYRGYSPFRADKQHLHHRLLRLGLSHLQSTLILAGFSLVFISIAFILDPIGVLPLTGILLVLAILLCLIPDLIYRKKRNNGLKVAEADIILKEEKAL